MVSSINDSQDSEKCKDARGFAQGIKGKGIAAEIWESAPESGLEFRGANNEIFINLHDN